MNEAFKPYKAEGESKKLVKGAAVLGLAGVLAAGYAAGSSLEGMPFKEKDINDAWQKGLKEKMEKIVTFQNKDNPAINEALEKKIAVWMKDNKREDIKDIYINLDKNSELIVATVGVTFKDGGIIKTEGLEQVGRDYEGKDKSEDSWIAVRSGLDQVLQQKS